MTELKCLAGMELDYIKITNLAINLIVFGFIAYMIYKVATSRSNAIKSFYRHPISDKDAYRIVELLDSSVIKDDMILIPSLKYYSIVKTGCRSVPYVFLNSGYVPRRHWLRPRLDAFYKGYQPSKDKDKAFADEIAGEIDRLKANTL